jgi:hypothetical protein
LIALISPEDPAWGKALRMLPHDVYHLPEYVMLSAEYDGGAPVAFHCTDGDLTLFLPVVLREVPAALGGAGTWRDAASPYGYPAPLVTPGASPDAVRRLLAGVIDECAERQIVSLFVRLHPLLGIPVAELAPLGSVVSHGSTVYVDLRQPAAAIERQVRRGFRYDIRKLEGSGFSAGIDEWARYGEFVTMYQETMQRVSAQDYYFFSKDYFSRLRSALGRRLHLWSVRSPEGDTAAAGLFSECEGLVQYLFSATAEPFVRQAPSKLMLHAAIHWARESGYRLMHLGGGVGGEDDSLLTFKLGFSDLRSGFCTFRAIPDQERYSRLVAGWRQLGGDADAAASGFFPVYRIPVAL